MSAELPSISQCCAMTSISGQAGIGMHPRDSTPDGKTSQYDCQRYLGVHRYDTKFSVTNLLEQTNAYQQTLALQCMNASALAVNHHA